MKLTKILAAASAALLLAGTSVAQASSAQSLSLANAPATRAATGMGDSNEVRGGFLIPAIALIAIIVGILIISEDSDSN